jgi:RAMP superfamily
MSLRLPQGHHVLCLETVSPANFGGAGGGATVDRPVAVDVFDELPYLPASALKGVLAGRTGNVRRRDGAINSRRSPLYGSPDGVAEDGGGRPGTLVFGDGELLSFPVALRDGRPAVVLIARTLFRLRQLGRLTLPGLRRIERDDAYQGNVDAGQLLVSARWADFGMAPATLAGLASRPVDAPVLAAAPRAAAALWRVAVEERTLAALGEDGRVEAGSLRTIELIPADVVFVSLVSNLGDEEANLGDVGVVQVGAWEGSGCGFLRLGVWQPPEEERSGEERLQPPGASSGVPGHEVMVRAFQAVEALRGTPAAAVARSAILDLGPRLRLRGLPGALAFCLARATGQEGPERKSRDREAYRWLLGALLGLDRTAGVEVLHERAVGAITGFVPPPAEFWETRLWLRRFSEMLPREEGTGG